MGNFENLSKFDQGYKGIIAGVDEAGRGPWAGPVVAAAVILNKGKLEGLSELDDSKKLTEKKREKLFEIIISSCLSYAVSEVSHKVIDRENILKATLIAMDYSIRKLDPVPNIVLIDGISKPDMEKYNLETVKDGDAKSLSIAAASVLAKVHRDRIMKKHDRVYPDYGFSRHKGYGTKEHIEALKKHGISDIHRISYKPVKAVMDGKG